MKTIAMIPARMGSQRLKKKNLAPLAGQPLITHAVQKCQDSGCFDEIYINSENAEFGQFAVQYGIKFYQRPEELGNSIATSEQFVYDFLKNVECDLLVQVHSIAPLLSAAEVKSFAEAFIASDADVMLSCIEDRIEVAYQDQPVNFTFAEKTNSQDLEPTQRVTWSITGWRAKSYIEAVEAGGIGTYNGKIAFYPVDPISGHVIKTQQDLDIAEALLSVLGNK
ncbi:acylneuraminate cytidylyltransferase family protein [Leisingera sp. ANG-M7]|uniref:acylneuraminate cytidylyltransferase family protein n=1 Tax=Leisingera sp. ANG-M7 TaxID=1577902 RepID=UPI00057E4120|nr:NTP transferase domain-containing protein [Leisingera sp. ANG-M7]KIC36432.1 cytidyltransferase [Leisingera sp. ANG-M7]